MRKLLFTFLVFLLYLICPAQTWVPVGNGLSAGGCVRTLLVNDSVMYAGGNFTSPGNNIAQWDNNKWEPMSSGINSNVYAMGLYNRTLYAGGYFSNAGGHAANCIATWDGSSFSTPGFSVQGGQVDAIVQYDSLLYIGGTFDSLNHHYNVGFFRWNGAIADSVFHSYGWWTATCLDTFNHLLLMGSNGYNNYLSTWNNKVVGILGLSYFKYFNTYPWTDLEENAFCEYKGNLYMGGFFESYDTTITRSIAMWDSHKWNALGGGIRGHVYALAVYDSLVIAGGNFDTVGGITANNIAAWDGTSWHAFGGGLDGPVYALTIFKGKLYAGGNFSTGNGIAQYVPQQVNDSTTLSATIYPNPNKGVFTLQLSSINLQLSVSIYNALGQKIYSDNFTRPTAQINLNGAMPGVYFYSISQPGKKPINTGKFVIE